MCRIFFANYIHENSQSDTMLRRATLQFPRRRLIELMYNVQRLVLRLFLVVVFPLIEISDNVGPHTVCGTHRLAYVHLPTLVSSDYDVNLGGRLARLISFFLTFRRCLL